MQINTLVTKVLPWLLERANVVHQCGPTDEAGLRGQAEALPPRLAVCYLLTGYMGRSCRMCWRWRMWWSVAAVLGRSRS